MYDVLVGASAADIRARTSPKVRGETIPPRDLSRTTRAENFDDYRGISPVDESKVRGTEVRATAERAWPKFADTLLGSGTDGFAARLAGAAGTVEVRLGSPTGALAATAQARPRTTGRRSRAWSGGALPPLHRLAPTAATTKAPLFENSEALPTWGRWRWRESNPRPTVRNQGFSVCSPLRFSQPRRSRGQVSDGLSHCLVSLFTP